MATAFPLPRLLYFFFFYNLNGLVGYYVSSNLNQTQDDCRRFRCQLQQYACGCASLSRSMGTKSGGQRDAAFDTNGPLHRIKSLTYRPLSGRRHILYIITLLTASQPASQRRPSGSSTDREKEEGDENLALEKSASKWTAAHTHTHSVSLSSFAFSANVTLF